MRRSDMLRIMLALSLGAALTWGGVGAGCNPNLVSSLGGTASLPTAPGANPYILVRFQNQIKGPPQNSGQTAASGVDFLATYRMTGAKYSITGVMGDGLEYTADFGELVPCNMTVITLGDVDDLTAPGAWVAYHGTLDPVLQPLAPFGKLLQNGVDFRCGDVLTFITYLMPENSRSYGVDYQVQSGASVTGPFSGPDTFTMFTDGVKAW